MIRKYTVRRHEKAPHIIITDREELMTPQFMGDIAFDCLQEGFYSDAAYYSARARESKTATWELVSSASDGFAYVDPLTVAKLARRGVIVSRMTRDLEPGESFSFTVCEY